MHIAEGILNGPTLAAGAAIAAAGMAYALRRLETERIPEIAILSATFFVASLIHVPVGMSSAHLILSGLLGIVLGWSALPAIFAGLLFQAVLFQFGGLTTLGVNTVVMGAPAVAAHLIFGRAARSENGRIACGAGALAAPFAIAMGCALVYAAMLFGVKEGAMRVGAGVFALSHLPIAIAESVVTGFAIGFLRQVKPDLLGIEYAPPLQQ